MAAVQRPNWIRAAQEQPVRSCLTGLECRCLLKHISECHELVQLTLLGAESAMDKAYGLELIRDLQEALRAAELQIARAERCALRLLGDGWSD